MHAHDVLPHVHTAVMRVQEVLQTLHGARFFRAVTLFTAEGFLGCSLQSSETFEARGASGGVVFQSPDT